MEGSLSDDRIKALIASAFVDYLSGQYGLQEAMDISHEAVALILREEEFLREECKKEKERQEYGKQIRDSAVQQSGSDTK